MGIGLPRTAGTRDQGGVADPRGRGVLPWRALARDAGGGRLPPLSGHHRGLRAI